MDGRAFAALDQVEEQRFCSNQGVFFFFGQTPRACQADPVRMGRYAASAEWTRRPVTGCPTNERTAQAGGRVDG